MQNKRQRKSWGAQFSDAINSIADELEAFRETAATLFHERIRHSPPPWKRKPPFGIRLHNITGDVRIVGGPRWLGHRKELDPEVLKIEVLWEVTTQDKEHGTLWVPHVFLKVDVRPDGPKWTLATRDANDLDKAVRELAEVASSFASNPMETFSRNSDNCGACGRALTDGQSKARGIGPECIKWLGIFRALKRSLFEAEPAPAGE